MACKGLGWNVQAPRIEAVSGPGIVGNALRLRVDLEIGGRFLFSQPASVMNLDDLPKRLGVQFDGLLGQDILRQFRSIRINYRAPSSNSKNEPRGFRCSYPTSFSSGKTPCVEHRGISSKGVG